MKKTIAILCLTPLMAMAQTTTSTSYVDANAKASSSNAGNAQNITFNSPPTPTTTTANVNYSGSYKTNQAVLMGGFAGSFSGDYCGGTSQIGAGFVGFSIAGGTSVIDSSCVLLRTYERTMQAAASATDPIQAFKIRSAALELLAEINPTVRNVFESKGLVQVKDVPVVAK